MDKTLFLDLKLREIYYNPVTGYQSAEKLYQSAIEEEVPGVTRKLVHEWMSEQRVYTVHKPMRKPKTRKTFVKNLADQVQLDLVDMTKFSKENKGYKWILTGIEILSRFAFACPVLRKNTENMVPAVSKILKEFKSHFRKYPETIQFDNGAEFYNVGVKALLKSKNIKYFSTYSSRKAALVERFNRTLKTRMWKYFSHEQHRYWIGSLTKFLKSYNNTIHSSIKMKPNQVNDKNQDTVFYTLYGLPPTGFPKPKFKVGDFVRIFKYKKNFAKGYDPNFTNEIFKISAVFRGNPNMYRISDEKKENIIGKFYNEELVLFKPSQEQEAQFEEFAESEEESNSDK